MEHPQLQDAVGALRVRASMEGLTFTACANHLSAQVSELPDTQSSRKIAATSSDRAKEPKRIRGGGSGPTKDSAKRKGIYMPDGSVWTGYYSDWSQMSADDKQTVLDTRKKNKGKSPKGRKVSEVGTKLKDIKSQMAELKRTIASLSKNKTSPDDGNESDTPDNAGDSFGGRQNKKQKKE